MSFAKRKIDLTFKLGKGGNFGQSSFDTLKVTGLRVKVNISNAGGASMGTANVRVNGLTLSQMNDLSTFIQSANGQIEVRYNSLIIEAGDEGAPLSKIFEGQITLGAIDMANAPDVSLNILAQAGYFEAVKSTDAVSYPGSSDVAVMMKSLADKNNLGFENNSNISIMLATQNLRGSARDQMARCADAAKINWTIDNGVLAIWPMGGTRGVDIVTISANNGMVGYPENIGVGIGVKTLFNHNLQLGKICQIQSILPYANGKFVIFNISHDLESEIPNGVWFSQFQGSPFNAR